MLINLRNPGQYYDQETGLFYNMARYCNPQTGRYITSDPIGLAGGINTYAYVNGSPLFGSDYMGTECSWCSNVTNTVLGWIKGLVGYPDNPDIVSETGSLVLEGGAAGLQGYESIAQADYNYYRSDDGTHLIQHFQDVDWRLYGTTFAQAWSNYVQGKLVDNPPTSPSECMP